jgi:CheY-like chemotaxis protein
MRTAKPILVAEDDPDEIFIYERVFKKLNMTGARFVSDGVEAVRYLRGEGDYGDRRRYPFPQWVFLDLKMPRMTGIDVLHWAHSNPVCRVIPTIMISNSAIQHDIDRAYDLGASAFFTKPTRMSETEDMFSLISQFWTAARLPTATPTTKCP